MLTFGPVPSRRLGRSLGINNLPLKTCSYSCVYCQLGRTTERQLERQELSCPETVLEELKWKIDSLRRAGEEIDYLTFVPDGEPTLDRNLGRTIDLLKPLGIKIAVITNSSLLWREDVREDLARADWVSLKIDAAPDDIWRRISRPHESCSLPEILEGAVEFALSFEGELATETMLVGGLNDSAECVRRTGSYIAGLMPSVSYLSVPTRPPAERWVYAPSEYRLNLAYQVFRRRLGQVRYLIRHEGNEFTRTGSAEEDLLDITAVHPMREDSVREYLQRAGAGPRVVSNLVDRGLLAEVSYEGRRFLVRAHGGWRRPAPESSYSADSADHAA
jgi:wyosine [tRNA(Phe)-imidazoG37] synthetase (radical SAM superfamily)